MTYGLLPRRIDTVVVGGGQAGLATGYFLTRQRRDFIILDAGERIGDSWRKRWDALRLFTPAVLSGLPGMPFPAPGSSFPAKDEVAEYLARYAEQFALPMCHGVQVEALSRHDGDYLLETSDGRYIAERVVIATGAYHAPHVPDFAVGLDSQIVQRHSSEYRNAGQLPNGDVLVVGAGNSGAEIAMDLVTSRRTYLAGRDTGRIPLRLIHNRFTLGLANRLLTTDTGIGRKMRDGHSHGGDPLIRLTSKDLAASGIERVPRVEGAEGGKPRLADGRVMDVAAVVWATGFRPDFGWVELPIFDSGGHPIHHRGIVEASSRQRLACTSLACHSSTRLPRRT